MLEPHLRVQYRRPPEAKVVEEAPPPPPMRWVSERFYDRLPTGPKRFVRKALALGWRVGVTDVGGTNLVVRAQRPGTRLAACWVRKGGGKAGPRWVAEFVLCAGAWPAPKMSVTEALATMEGDRS